MNGAKSIRTWSAYITAKLTGKWLRFAQTLCDYFWHLTVCFEFNTDLGQWSYGRIMGYIAPEHVSDPIRTNRGERKKKERTKAAWGIKDLTGLRN